MRLCLIANPNSVHTQRWVRYFAARGDEVHLVGDKPLAAALPDGVHYHDLTQVTNRRKARYLAWALVVRRLVRELQPDVLHGHQVTSAGWLAAAAGYRPLLVTAWGSDLLVAPQRSRAQRWLAQWVLRRADYVTAVSQALADAAVRLGSDPHRTEVVPWGVDTAIFYPAAEPAPTDRPPTVLSLRALQPIYNPLTIAAAIPQVLRSAPQARFLVFTYNSDPALLRQFQEAVAKAGADHAVEYVPPLPDDRAIAEVCRRADVAISVPTSDGTPRSVLEAMACGAVPVLSDVPSLHEWVAEGQEGLYVPVGDAEALAAAVARLLTDRDLRGRLRAGCLRVVAERADSRVWMARYAQIYAQLAAGQRPQPPQPWAAGGASRAGGGQAGSSPATADAAAPAPSPQEAR
ncbi:MAG: glycosyltransferase family 4 protein [Anaerolineae bacterium]|nr:glycosyltransferase family 4 protein [Anaerolineae bacterium]